MVQIGEKLECWAEVEQEGGGLGAVERLFQAHRARCPSAHRCPSATVPPSPSEPHQAHPRRGKSRPSEPRPALQALLRQFAANKRQVMSSDDKNMVQVQT